MGTGCRAGAARLVVLIAGLAIVACSSDQERAQSYLEKANALMADGRRAEASLEYRSALRFDPRNVEANNRLAQLELLNGNLPAALSYMQEAYRLDPTNAQAALNLASVLRSDQPERAEALVEAVIEREPDKPDGYIGRSNIALEQGRMREAVLAARKAMEVAPDSPAADWQYGYVLQGMIRKGQVTGEQAEDKIFTEALHSFERYIAKGGEAPWTAQVEEARVLAAWPTRGREAAAMFRIAVQNSLDHGTRADQMATAAQAAGFAQDVGDNELLEWSLERLLEIDPRNLRSWQGLSQLYARTRRDPEEVWKRALAELPDEPRVHIEYARFMISRWKLDEALAYLEKKAADGIDPPLLLSAKASTELAAKRLPDARATVRKLEKAHPNHPRTVLARAQLDMRQGQIAKAASSLRQLGEQYPDADVFGLLARAEEVLGRKDEAMAAINRAIELDPHFGSEDQRMRARLLAAEGNCHAAVRNLLAIRDQMPLTLDDRILLARCRYETGQGIYGRALLREIVGARAAPIEAILMLARKEGDNPQDADLARRELHSFVMRNPTHWEALRELTRLDVSRGRGDAALARLDRLLARSEEIPAPIRLLRAQLSADQGREAGVLEDAEAAFEAQPQLRGALELVVTLLLRKGEVDRATAAAERAQREGALHDDRLVLLGQLYRMGGRDEDAVALFAKAVAAGAEDPSYYYQMGLALRSLNRGEEAAQAFEKALSLSTSFPDADDARRALEGARSAGAS